MPTTSYPSDFNSSAVTEESTPPDIATTTLVSCGRPSISRLLSMVPFIDAIATAPRLRDQEATLRLAAFWSVSLTKRICLIGAAEKPLFNIGRIHARQSRSPLLQTANGKSCRRAEKGSPEPRRERPYVAARY